MTTESSPSRPSFQADSLALGMFIMLVLTVVQRGVGFFRGILFCRLLDDSDLGRWAMAFGFISTITPVLLLGIPGSLPRFVEHFRVRGQLPAFVRRIAGATLVCIASGLLAMNLFPHWFGWLIFLEPESADLIQAVAVAMASIVLFNFVNDMNSSLRQVRVVSLMQFMQGVGFTVGGVAWLAWGGGLTGLLFTFAATTLVATAPGFASLRRGWQGLPAAEVPFEPRAMWKRLLPYAAAIWAMNFLGNVFDLSDRYMILHFTAGGETAGQSAVGQFHSGRIIPELFLNLALMVSGILMPYLTADWEAGKPEAVRHQLRRTLFAMSVLFTVGASVAMGIAPWMFDVWLEGRYGDGLELMPLAFVFCSWAGLATIGQDYLFIAEKGKWVAAALAVGLLANLALNALLIPLRGLEGAVLATLSANGIVMVGVWLGMARCGYGFDRTALYVALLPATLLAGPAVAITAAVVTALASEDARGWAAEAWRHWQARRRPATA